MTPQDICDCQAVTNPTNTVYATKRLIGRPFDDPQTAKEAQVRRASSYSLECISALYCIHNFQVSNLYPWNIYQKGTVFLTN